MPKKKKGGGGSKLTLWTIHLALSLGSPPVNRFQNIDDILSIALDKIHFIVVTCAEIAHDVFISEEKHDCKRLFVGI